MESVAAKKWFHAIDFGDYASAGRFRQGTPQNVTLYGVFEFLQNLRLADADLLDIGASDGLVAFGSRKLGAASVTAVDTGRHESFLLARELLGYTSDDVEYLPGMQIKDLADRFEPKSFDVIVCAGVFYHMLHPMQAFTECRKVLRDGGVLILETPFEDARDDAVLIFNGVEHVVNEPYTYFVPTRSALLGMASLGGYRLIACRTLQAPKRITLLLKADTREEIIADAATPPFVVQMLKRDTCDDSFRFHRIEADTCPAADLGEAIYTMRPERTIVSAKEKVTFPYHPPRDRPVAGSTRFENPDGNTKVL